MVDGLSGPAISFGGLASGLDTNALINSGHIQEHLEARLVVIFQVAQNLDQPVTANPKCRHAFRSMLTDKFAFAEFAIQGVNNRW